MNQGVESALHPEGNEGGYSKNGERRFPGQRLRPPPWGKHENCECPDPGSANDHIAPSDQWPAGRQHQQALPPPDRPGASCGVKDLGRVLAIFI
jgi:hypothetical protein